MLVAEVQAAPPIEVGAQRQLFADDYVISDMYGLEITMCNPQKYPSKSQCATRRSTRAIH